MNTTVNPWEPDRIVSAATAAELIDAQFPELAPARPAPFGVGWDNTVFLVRDDIVFRFPRREIAVALIEAEIAALPHLAPRITTSIPVPEYVGTPTDSYPWPFAGFDRIEGAAASQVATAIEARTGLAPALGAFLAELHSIPPESVPAIAPDPIGRFDVATRTPRLVQWLDRLAATGRLSDPGSLAAIAEHAGRVTSATGAVVVHGDLDARHVFVGSDGKLAGIIDWGDVHLGTPAADFAGIHEMLPAPAHEAFRDAYGPIDEPAWQRARFRAVQHATGVALSGIESGDETMADEGLAALERIRSAGVPG